jgi:hypothetical protein
MDYTQYDVLVFDEEIKEFVKSMSLGNPYLSKDETVGFLYPPHSVRCVFIEKEKEECQNLSLDQEKDLNS